MDGTTAREVTTAMAGDAWICQAKIIPPDTILEGSNQSYTYIYIYMGRGYKTGTAPTVQEDKIVCQNVMNGMITLMKGEVKTTRSDNFDPTCEISYRYCT